MARNEVSDRYKGYKADDIYFLIEHKRITPVEFREWSYWQMMEGVELSRKLYERTKEKA